MDFFGKIGIDFKLLIAQLINFGILVLILKKFVFSPLLREIEKEKEKEKALEENLRKIQEKKEEIEIEKREIIKKAQREAKKLIEETRKIAQKIKEKAQKEGEKIEREIIERANLSASFQKEIIKEEIKKEMEKKVKERLSYEIKNLFSERKKLILDVFFAKLKESLEKISFEEILLPKNDKKRKKTTKVGVLFEYFPEIKDSQVLEIRDLIAKKLEISPDLIEVKKRENPDLLFGFYLETQGQSISWNLREIIKDALKD